LAIIKKLLLAVIGGVLAASGFYWYLGQANPLLRIAEDYQQSLGLSGSGLPEAKPINLPTIDLTGWNKAAHLEVLNETFDLTKVVRGLEEQDLVGTGADPLFEYWLNGVLKRRAEVTGKAPLSDGSSKTMSNLLLNIREVTVRSALAKGNDKALVAADKFRIATLMAKGEVMFTDELGEPLSAFIATLSKDELKMLFNPSPKT